MPLTDCPQPQLRQAQQLIPIEPGKLGNRLRAIVFYFFLSHNHDGTEPSPTIKYHHITRKHPTRYYVKSRISLDYEQCIPARIPMTRGSESRNP
jgi:hypothetical protein